MSMSKGNKQINKTNGTITVQERYLHSGPLPHPEILEWYEKVSPGAADIIIERFVKQSDHRISIEKKVIDSNITNERLGLLLGFILALVSLLGAFVLLYSNKTLSGLSTFLSTLALLIGLFIKSYRDKEKEMKDKQTD